MECRPAETRHRGPERRGNTGRPQKLGSGSVQLAEQKCRFNVSSTADVFASLCSAGSSAWMSLAEDGVGSCMYVCVCLLQIKYRKDLLWACIWCNDGSVMTGLYGCQSRPPKGRHMLTASPIACVFPKPWYDNSSFQLRENTETLFTDICAFISICSWGKLTSGS